MKLSVVIPVRRHPNIAACLGGVFALQGRRPDEVIVVENDASQLQRDIICGYPVRYLCEPGAGVYRARNRGIQEARGDIVVFLDADCVPTPRWLVELIQGFDCEGVGGVAGPIRKKASPHGLVAASQREFLLHDGLQYLPPIFAAPYAPGGNVAYRKHVLDELGHFDTSFTSGGDVDISWRMQLAGYALSYRRAAAVSAQPLPSAKDYFKRYYKYSLGQVMLYRKYRALTGKRMLFNAYPFVGASRALKALLTQGLYELIARRDPSCAAGHAMDLVEHLALISGALVGSIRYRVVYI